MNGSSVDERGKTHHGKSNLFQETPKPLCSTFLPTDVKHCLNVGYTFVNFTTSEAVWKSHVCITRKSWPLFKSKKIAQVVRAWIQSKNSLVKHFEDMRLCRPSKEYLQVWFDPPRDESMSCLTTKGMRNNGAMCASISEDCLNAAKIPQEELFKETKFTKSLYQQGMKNCQKENHHIKVVILCFDVMPEDKIDHRNRKCSKLKEDKRNGEGVSTDFEKVSTDKPIVSTDGSKVSTDKQIEGTDEKVESTEEIFECTKEQREGTEEKVESTAGQIKATLLLNMSQAKSASKEKRKGVELKDFEKLKDLCLLLTRSLLTLTSSPPPPPPTPQRLIQKQRKKKIEEEDETESEDDDIPQAMKKFKQLESDEEMARKIQEECEAEEERNKINEEKATNEALIKNFGDIKARIEEDRILAEKIQEQEREQFTIEERAKFLHDTIAAQRKKRRFKQDTSQDDPSDIEKENDELRLCLTIAPDEDKEVDYEILDKKYPIIDWKTENLGTKPQFDESKRSEEINMNVVTRSNGQKRSFSTLIRVLSVFDREDLDAVYKLVMDIYQDKIPEGFDKVLWGDLIVMFNPDEQDEFWNSQHEWKVVSWKLHSSSGVHTLMTDEGLVVHMLIEKKYPLKKEILMQMLKLKLESEEESTMALELIRFIKKVLADLESKE
ncbi:ribonuclease H-like domain-containing protein [Tanacetum coccineum]